LVDQQAQFFGELSDFTSVAASSFVKSTAEDRRAVVRSVWRGGIHDPGWGVRSGSSFVKSTAEDRGLRVLDFGMGEHVFGLN